MSTMEAKLVGAALAMKGSLFCSNMMTDLGLEPALSSVPLYIDNTATLHVIGNRTFSTRMKRVSLRFFYIRWLVKGANIEIQYVSTDKQLTDMRTEFLSRLHNQYLIH